MSAMRSATLLTSLVLMIGPLVAAEPHSPRGGAAPNSVPRVDGGVARQSVRRVSSDWSLGDVRRAHFFFASGLHAPRVSFPGQLVSDLQFARFRPDGRIYGATESEFLHSLRPGVPVCVVVHGSFVPNNEFAGFLQAYRWVRSAAPRHPLHVVFYRWPSNADLRMLMPQVQVEELGQRAELHGIRLAKLLRMLPAENPVSILAHSHGTRCAASALHLLAGGRVHNFSLEHSGQQRRYRVVFGAAAIDHHWLNPSERYGHALLATDALLNLRTRFDWALGLYPYRNASSRPALGMIGLTAWDRAGLGAEFSKYRELDVSQIVGSGHTERAYFRHASIARSIAPFLYFFDYGSPSNTSHRPRL